MKMKRPLMRQGSGVVYHYTSVDTFLKLLAGIKYNYFRFWASDIFTMNDPTEFYHGFEKLWKLLPEIEDALYKRIRENPNNYQINTTCLDDQYRLSNIWKRKYNINVMKEWIPEYVNMLHEIFETPFVVSFSCQKDFLPMWSTYGDSGKGVALGIEVQSYYIKTKLPDGKYVIDFTKNDPTELHSLLVTYKNVTIQHPLSFYFQTCLCKYLASIPLISDNPESLEKAQMDVLDKMFIIASALIKNKSYSYEEESRLLYERWRISDVKFRTDASKNIIPYILVGIPIDKLKEIIIGPRCDFKFTKMIIKTRLTQLGVKFNDENIIQSGVPFR